MKVFEDSMELTESSVRLRLGQSAALWQLKQYMPATDILRLIQPSRTTQPGEVEWKILGGPALKPVLFSYPRGVVNPLRLLEIEDDDIDDIESDFPSSISPDTLVQRPESSQGDLNSTASSSAPNTEGDAMDIEDNSSSSIAPEERMQSADSSERDLNTPTSSPLVSSGDASLSEEELDSANVASPTSRLKRSTSTSFDENNGNKRNKI